MKRIIYEHFINYRYNRLYRKANISLVHFLDNRGVSNSGNWWNLGTYGIFTAKRRLKNE